MDEFKATAHYYGKDARAAFPNSGGPDTPIDAECIIGMGESRNGKVSVLIGPITFQVDPADALRWAEEITRRAREAMKMKSAPRRIEPEKGQRVKVVVEPRAEPEPAVQYAQVQYAKLEPWEEQDRLTRTSTYGHSIEQLRERLEKYEQIEGLDGWRREKRDKEIEELRGRIAEAATAKKNQAALRDLHEVEIDWSSIEQLTELIKKYEQLSTEGFSIHDQDSRDKRMFYYREKIRKIEADEESRQVFLRVKESTPRK